MIDRRVRFKVKRMVFAAALLSGITALLIPVARLAHYARVQQQMYDAIAALRVAVPSGVVPSTWDCACGYTLTAYANVCFSPDHVPIEELYRLREELSAKLRGPIGPGTLAWICARLSRTGPYGQRYMGRVGPRLVECFPPGAAPRLNDDDHLQGGSPSQETGPTKAPIKPEPEVPE